MKIYCCGCEKDVEARLTDGDEIYPHRPDLFSLPFWKCDTCGNFVGCHHKTKTRTKPLGCIPTPELRMARNSIHSLLDPAWQSGKIGRKELYRVLTEKLGWKYHTAKIKSLDEAEKVIQIILNITP
jgi:hypothetical protein